EGLESEEDAIKCARELYKNTNKTRKKKFIPPQLEHIQRDGPANGISEDNPADGDRYMKDFGFSGGEFGNWMSEADRQASLNMGYDAFCDLAYALGIDREEISLNNQLSIAFGARGSGTAMAHYEPDRQVINLTKMKGAGSLAHEWGHAFDDFVGRHLGLNGFMSANIYSDAVPQSMRDLVMAMKWKPATDSEKNESVLKRQKRADYLLGQIFQGVGVESKLNESQMVEWKQLKENIIKTVKEHSADDCEIKWVGELVEELSAFKSKITGHIISKSNRDQMIFMIRSAKAAYEFKPDKLCVETDFYKNSVKADAAYSKESKGYWHSEEEMFARAFACYVHDRLPWRSDYLCGHSESAGFYEYVNEERVWIKAIPQGEERENLNRCFDRVIEECKQLEIFKPQQMMQRTVRKAR
ncbi:MAG: LPD1 domain-containing protein, partial [Roseburia sp.]